jgi:hypothetical protein
VEKQKIFYRKREKRDAPCPFLGNIPIAAISMKANTDIAFRTFIGHEFNVH